jgi:hypothetical protein
MQLVCVDKRLQLQLHGCPQVRESLGLFLQVLLLPAGNALHHSLLLRLRLVPAVAACLETMWLKGLRL